MSWLRKKTLYYHRSEQPDLTFLQLSVPHFDDEPRVFAVVDDPQRQSLDALLRAAQLRQLFLQGRLREGRHAGE